MSDQAPVDKDRADVPYVAPLPPAAPPTHGVPTISTLPPIATSRPLGHAAPYHHQYQHHYQQSHANGNIPVVNGVRQPFPVAQLHYAPTIVNLAAAPSAAAPHLPPDMQQPLPPSAPFYEYMDKCRYAAGIMLIYYLCTFFFLQPFFLGVLGAMTGFLGYYGSRPPIFAAHVKWIRGYLWMNMSMLVMNVWYFAILLFYLSSPATGGDSTTTTNKGGDVGSSSSDDATYVYGYDSQQLGLFIGLVIGLNLVLHMRGVRTARCFHAEMLRAGPLPGQRTVIVLAAANPV